MSKEVNLLEVIKSKYLKELKDHAEYFGRQPTSKECDELMEIVVESEFRKLETPEQKAKRASELGALIGSDAVIGPALRD